MQVFFFLLAMLVIAFASSFYILGRNNSQDITFISSIMASYQLMLGDFDTDDFGKVGFTIIYIIFFFASLLLIVVMLNLLIAVISDTFTVVQEQKDRKMYQEFTRLIIDNKHLLARETVETFNRQGNYLFMAEQKQYADEEDKDLLGQGIRDIKESLKGTEDKILKEIMDLRLTFSQEQKISESQNSRMRASIAKRRTFIK